MTQTIAAEPEARPAEEPGPRRRAARLRAVTPPALAILGGLAAIAWRASRYGNWLVDDAGITFAYARSFARGLGPVVAPGAPPVEGYSNPTWTALLALGKLLGLFDRGTWFGTPDYVAFPKALALVCCAGMLGGCYYAARGILRRPWAAPLAVGVVVAAIPSFVIWCFSGLENALLALVVVWLAAVLVRGTTQHRLADRRVAVTVGLLAAAAALTRPDGMIYAAAYPAALLLSARRPFVPAALRRSVLAVCAFAVPFGGYLLWRYLEFGRLLSNTAVAKSQGLPRVDDLGRFGELAEYAGALAVLVLGLAVGLSLARAPWRAALATLLVPFALAVVAFVVIEPDWMGQYRFATPVWALGALTGVLAMAGALRPSPPRGRALLAACAVVATVGSAAGLWTSGEEFRDEPTLPMCTVADRVGRVFNNYADILRLPHASVLAPDLGGSSLTSRLRLVDMAGLANAPIADYIHSHDYPGLRDYVFDRVRPTFIQSHGPWGPGNKITSDFRIDRDYLQITEPAWQWGKPAGDWVRKSAVRSPADLARLRAYAADAVPSINRKMDNWPLRSCGATLRPGDTRINLAR